MTPTLTMRPLTAVSVGFIPHIVKAQDNLREDFGLVNLIVVKGSQRRQSNDLEKPRAFSMEGQLSRRLYMNGIGIWGR